MQLPTLNQIRNWIDEQIENEVTTQVASGQINIFYQGGPGTKYMSGPPTITFGIPDPYDLEVTKRLDELLAEHLEYHCEGGGPGEIGRPALVRLRDVLAEATAAIDLRLALPD